jgi:hypothetical protein
VLENLRNVRVDLRFREDGIHTTLTLTRRNAPQGMTKVAFLEALVEGLRSPDPAERKLAEELASGENRTPVLNAVTRALQSEDAAERRWAVSIALKLGARAQDTFPVLLKMLRTELRQGSRAERRWAVEALGNLGPDAGPAIPDLLVALLDEDVEVRRAAVLALKKIEPDGAR